MINIQFINRDLCKTPPFEVCACLPNLSVRLIPLMAGLEIFNPAVSSDFLGLVYWTLALCLWEVNY